MLLYNNATYMQVLEGPEKDVHEIYESILKDSRNTGNVKLLEEPIDQRDFSGWSMGFKNLESCTPEELPGFSEIFDGKLDKDIACNNKSFTINLLINFSKTI